MGVSDSTAWGKWGANIHTIPPAHDISDVRTRGSQEFGLEDLLVGLIKANFEFSVIALHKLFLAPLEFLLCGEIFGWNALLSSESEHFFVIHAAVHQISVVSLKTSNTAIVNSGFFNNILDGFHFCIALLHHVHWNSSDVTIGLSDGKAISFGLITSLQRPARNAIPTLALSQSLNVQIFAFSNDANSLIDALLRLVVIEFKGVTFTILDLEASLVLSPVVESRITDCEGRGLGSEGNWHDCESVFDHVVKHFHLFV